MLFKSAHLQNAESHTLSNIHPNYTEFRVRTLKGRLGRRHWECILHKEEHTDTHEAYPSLQCQWTKGTQRNHMGKVIPESRRCRLWESGRSNGRRRCNEQLHPWGWCTTHSRSSKRFAYCDWGLKLGSQDSATFNGFRALKFHSSTIASCKLKQSKNWVTWVHEPAGSSLEILFLRRRPRLCSPLLCVSAVWATVIRVATNGWMPFIHVARGRRSNAGNLETRF